MSFLIICQDKHLGHTSLAAHYGRKENLCYLLEVTKELVNEEGISPYRGQHGAGLIIFNVYADLYVHNYPNPVTEKNTIYTDLVTALLVQLARPNAFQSERILANEKKALESPLANHRR